MASVTLEHVYKKYGEQLVVKDANLTIEDGDFLVLVGPSGCGKSTTLRMIAGLEQISEGTLKIGERVVNKLSPRDRDVAMVFQSYALYPHMTVKENISFGLKLRKMPKAEIESRIAEAAQMLGLKDLLERKPKQLSGGQRQRVAMGRAIVRQPQVFLFDEPLSNLDAKLRVQMRAEIARLHQRLGTTTIYVTHDQIEAMTLAKHIVVMNSGIIQQVGAPLELYRSPANMFVAGFIGSPAMNFFDVAAVEKNGAVNLVGQGFEVMLPERFKAQLSGERELVLGVRPEDLREAGAGGGGMNRIPGKVEVLEPLGAEVHALGTVGGQALTARLSPDTRVRVGETIALEANLQNIHVFEKKSGLAIGRKAAI